MKFKIHFSKSDLIAIAAIIIGGFIAIYNAELKTSINAMVHADWTYYLFWLCVIVLIWRLNLIILRNSILRHNQQLIENSIINQRYVLPYVRLVRDVLLANDKKEVIARKLLEADFKLPDLEIMGFSDEIKNEFLRIAYEHQARKLRDV